MLASRTSVTVLFYQNINSFIIFLLNSSLTTSLELPSTFTPETISENEYITNNDDDNNSNNNNTVK
jgi:hypothetical protein